MRAPPNRHAELCAEPDPRVAGLQAVHAFFDECDNCGDPWILETWIDAAERRAVYTPCQWRLAFGASGSLLQVTPAPGRRTGVVWRTLPSRGGPSDTSASVGLTA